MLAAELKELEEEFQLNLQEEVNECTPTPDEAEVNTI